MQSDRSELQAPLIPLLLERSAEADLSHMLVLEDEAVFERLTGRPRRLVESLLEVSLTTLAVADGFELTADLYTPGAATDHAIAAALVVADDGREILIDLTPTDDTLTRWTGRHTLGSKPTIGAVALRAVQA